MTDQVRLSGGSSKAHKIAWVLLALVLMLPLVFGLWTIGILFCLWVGASDHWATLLGIGAFPTYGLLVVLWQRWEPRDA